MTDADGILKERTDYSPYGVARQRPPADLNGDGKIDGVDQLIFFNAWGAAIGAAAYNPDADINFDGQVNGDDFLILSNAFGADPAPPGAVSQHGNTVGYSGYIYDDAIGLSLARFRWYDAETGRWATRDPKFYVEGSSLYEYIRSSPINSTDPHGLFDPGWARPNRPNPFYPDNNTCNAPLKDLLDQIRDNYNNAFTPNERAAISCGAGFLKCLGIDVALGGISALALFGDCARMGRINTDAMLNCFLRRGKFLVFRTGPLGVASCVKDLTFCLDNTFDFLPARDRILDILDNVPPPFEHPFPGRGLP